MHGFPIDEGAGHPEPEAPPEIGALELWDTWWRLRDALIAHPVDSLALFESLKFEFGGLEEQLVLEARKERRTWQEIGDALGCSRQAARQRYRRVDDEIADSDRTRSRTGRYLERETVITCLDCRKDYYSARGDLAAISSKIIRPHEAARRQPVTPPAEIRRAKQELRRGARSAQAGRWRIAVAPSSLARWKEQ